MPSKRSWSRANARIEAVPEPARGRVQRDDPRYNPQTRVQKPISSPPFYALQQVQQQGGENTLYYTHSPFLTSSNPQPLQHGSQAPMSHETFPAPYQGYGPIQGRSTGHGSHMPSQNSIDANVQPQYADQSLHYQPYTVDVSKPWPDQSASQNNWPPQQRTPNKWQAPHQYDRPQAARPYNDQNYYAVQRSLTEDGHWYASVPGGFPQSYTRPGLPGWEWEWESGWNA